MCMPSDKSFADEGPVLSDKPNQHTIWDGKGHHRRNDHIEEIYYQIRIQTNPLIFSKNRTSSSARMTACIRICILHSAQDLQAIKRVARWTIQWPNGLISNRATDDFWPISHPSRHKLTFSNQRRRFWGWFNAHCKLDILVQWEMGV